VTDDLLIALSNPFDDATWKPGGTSVFVGVTTLGSVANADGTAVTFPMPKDAVRASSLVDFQILWGADWGLRAQGIYWDPDQIKIGRPEDADGTFSATGTIYGAITRITAFVTPSAEIA
jgi:hypothetical protein